MNSDPFLKASPLDLKFVPSVYAEDLDDSDYDWAADDDGLITPSALLIYIKDPNRPQVLPNIISYYIIMFRAESMHEVRPTNRQASCSSLCSLNMATIFTT